METRDSRFLERLGENLNRDTPYLHIHLYGGHAIFCTGNFKVHVAVLVFWSLDVSEKRVVLSVLHHQTRCNTGNGCGKRNASVEECERRGTHRTH